MADKNIVGGGVPDTPEKKRLQEKETVGLMIELYCRGNHGTPKGKLCPDCAALRDYADARVDHCPQRLQEPLLQARNAGADPPGHALERPADAVPPSRAGGTASGGDKETEEGAINTHRAGGVPCPVLYCRGGAVKRSRPLPANPLDIGAAAVNAAGWACPAPTTL